MPQALQVVTGHVTAPGAALTALTMNTGDSATISNYALGKHAWLLSLWAFNQVAGTIRMRSPKLHDNLQGIRYRVTAADVEPLYPSEAMAGFEQMLFPQDNLTLEQSGSGVAGQIEEFSFLVYYEDLPGVAARLTDPATVQKSGVNLVTQEVTVIAVATGDYGGAVAINSSFDTLKANTDYAILGGLTDTRGTTIGVKGVDTGNTRVGIPCEPSIRHVTHNWFQRLASIYGIPMIPVVNSANKAAINIDIATNQAGGTFIVTLNMVELAAGAVPGATLPR